MHKPRAENRVIGPTISSDHHIILLPGTREEREYVDLFCKYTSRAMSGFFASEFWDCLLPQLSHSEPAVRHAIVAMSATHKRYIYDISSSFSSRSASDLSWSESSEKFVLQQYNKAIGHLTAGLSSTVDLTLITCCLFICLEVLRGNEKQAWDHVAAGLRILSSMQKPDNLHTSPQTSRTWPSVMRRELHHLFSRLNIQMSLFGRPLAPFDPSKQDSGDNSPNESKPFATVLEARCSLDTLMINALKFVRSATEENCGIIPGSLPRDQRKIRNELDEWSNEFENLMKKITKRVKQPDSRGAHVLRIHYRVTRIWLETCLSPDAMGFDKHGSDFEAIISNAAMIISEESTKIHRATEYDTDPCGNFCLDMGLIPPLYYTAVKCRDPSLRRIAIDLLATYRRQEGLWEAWKQAKIAGYVMGIEEGRQSHLPVEARIPPRDVERIYEVLILEETKSRGIEFILMSKPNGADGDWHSETHVIEA
jgi:hypothetical protein